MLAYVIIFGLVLGTCYWILHPLLREEDIQDNLTPQPEDVLARLKNKKDGVYATIKELAFDLSMGKLSEEDFKILKRQYLQEAAGYMAEMDKLESLQATVAEPAKPDPEEEIEPPIASHRPQRSSQRKHIYCTNCGEKAAAGSRFCAACGSNLHKQDRNHSREEN
jgi:hypothetical protein